jgi:pycsar effector protein
MAGQSIPAGLVAAHEQVRDELRRADGKATTLLSLVGAVLAGVVALSGRHLPDAAMVALWASAVPFATSVIHLLLVIRPRCSRDPVPGSWLYAATHGPASLLESYGGDEPMTMALHVCRLAAAARVKYRRIAHALTFLTVGLGVLGVALVLSVVAR